MGMGSAVAFVLNAFAYGQISADQHIGRKLSIDSITAVHTPKRFQQVQINQLTAYAVT
jgi:hypothetical protein